MTHHPRKNKTGYWDKLHSGRSKIAGPDYSGMTLAEAHAARIRFINTSRQAKQEDKRRAKKSRAEDLRAQQFAKKARVVRIEKAKPAKQTFDEDGRPIYRSGMIGNLFYKTRQWIRLRYKAIEKYGRTCACCGASPRIIHVDHIKPRSVFPELELTLDNLQILCEECNIGKGADYFTDWRKSGG